MSDTTLKTSSPLRINSPESYESAAKEIEQEKLLVKNLKRLSMGHLLDQHDPDFPVDANDDFYHHLQDPERNDHSTGSIDTLSLSSASSEHSAASHTPPLDAHHSSRSLSKDSSPTRPSQYVTPEGTDTESEDHPVDPSSVLWLPANLHPEVNPQQFKKHVKSTIDELLERKLSRSKSSRNSKRSSLSFSTDLVDSRRSPEAEEHPNYNDQLLHEPRNRMSNPSLLRLSSELENLSRRAGMDSDDAVTLARSLSTSSLGYTDVERAAFDELGSPNSPGSANQAEVLDFGSDEPTSPSRKPLIYQPQGTLPRSSRIPTYDHQYQQNLDHQQRPPFEPNQHQQQQQHYYQQHYHQQQQQPYRQVELPQSGFSLKRTRRVGQRKLQSPSNLHLGSQLQSKKAENLANLRHNLSASDMTMSDSREATMLSGDKDYSRLSMQSINPRNSQALFAYKNSKHHRPGAPQSKPPSQSPPVPSTSSPMMKDSPYASASSSLIPLSQSLHHTKYGHHNIASKHQHPYHGHHPRQVTPNMSRSALHEQFRNHQRQPRHVSDPRYQHDLQQRNMGGQYLQGVSRSSSDNALPQRRMVSPTMGSQQFHEHQKRHVSPNHYPQQHMPYPNAHPSASQHHHRTPNAPLPQQQILRNEPPRWEDRQRSLSYSHPAQEKSAPQLEMKKVRDAKSEKSSQLNENLDMLRNEINEFKERLSRGEPKPSTPVPIAEPAAEPEQKPESVDLAAPEQVPDFSFDLSSHDVSYEDTLGIEQEVLKELRDEGISSTPRGSPEKKQTPEPVTPSDLSPRKTHVFGGQEPFRMEQRRPQQSSRTRGEEWFQQFSEEDRQKENNEPKIEETLAARPREQPKKEEPEAPALVHEISVPRRDDDDHPNDFNMVSEQPEEQEELPVSKSKKSNETVIERKQTFNEGELISASKAEKDRDSADLSPLDPVVEPRQSAESKIVKKKKSFGSLGGEKKSSKKPWPWSKSRSSSTNDVPKSTDAKKPSRSISSPDVGSAKKESKESNKENVITKLFKKKRSNSHSVVADAPKEEPEAEDPHIIPVKRRTNPGSNRTKKHSQEENVSKRSAENKRHSAERRTSNEDKQDSTKSRLKNKLRSMTGVSEDKTEEVPVTDSVTVDEPIEDAQEAEEKEKDQKPQTTLEVQEKIKKSIKRTSRANQPIEFSDSAFGFPLPPPSTSTLVMLDYRFPVHVERAIYRLSHLKLANRKRSLREQVLLSNFMYAYLNLVDHTLHLEQQMTADDPGEMGEPETDIGLFDDADADTEFEMEEEPLEDEDFGVHDKEGRFDEIAA